MINFLPLYNSEYDLVKALVRKENRDYQLFYDRFSGKLLAICSRYISDRMAAEDVMVEGVMKVFEKVEQFSFSGSFEGWVRRIMVNESISYLRVHKNIKFIDDETFFEERFNNIESQFSVEDIQLLIDNLPDGYRMVFNLYAIEGYKHHEIATMLGISEGTSKSQLSHARKMLQNQINKSKNFSNGTE